MGIDRRDFLKVATAGAGLAIVGNEAAAAEVTETKCVPLVRGGQVPDIVLL